MSVVLPNNRFEQSRGLAASWHNSVRLSALFVQKQRRATGIMVGVPPSLYIMGSGLAAYGLPRYTAAWVIEVLQFLSIGLAVLLAVVLFSCLPLIIGSSDRAARLR